MSWSESAGGDRLADVLALMPALRERYQAFLESHESTGLLPDRTLALCRARVAAIHGQPLGDALPEAEREALSRGDFSPFSEEEQAALRVAERVPYQHHQLEDEEVEAVKSHYGDAGVVALLTAVSFYDVNTRLALSLGVANN